MGSSTSLRTKTHLEQSEVEKISTKNMYLKFDFNIAKNADGFLTIKELKILTNGLINEKILKKIIQICGSKKNKLNYDDFCYFYALLITSSLEGKLNFLLDFIFIKKGKLTKEKYINKVNKYFSNSKLLLDIFLNNKIIQNYSNLSRQDIYIYIEKNYKKEIENYILYQNKLEQSKISNELEIINLERNENSQNTISINKENSNTSINSINIEIVKNQEYDSLEREFNNIEEINNGIFPISKFEDMLKEIDVDDAFIEIIGDYLRRKTKKSFINFDLFKEILSLLISDEKNGNYKEICKRLFDLISYPKNYIDKKKLINLLKKDKYFEKKLNKLEIGNKIDLNQFQEINKNIDNTIFNESLEHLKYLKYIFFKEKAEDISVQAKCFEIILKGKELEDYILERLQYDTYFYLVDCEFFEKWNESFNKLKEERNCEKEKLRINTTNFTDINGKIVEGKSLGNDYLILSKTIYNLFVDWYGPPIGMEIIRQKIYLDDDLKDNQTKKKKDKKSTVFGIDKKTNKKFELELYPIFLQFHSFLDLVKIMNNSLNKIIDKLKNLYNEDDSVKAYSFSRKCTFLEMANRLGDNFNINNIRFLVYFNDKLEIVGMNDSLEDLDITNKAIVLIEQKVNNAWIFEKLQNGNIISKEKNKEYLVGLYNIGNTCFMNSVLQIFLNIKKIKDLFIYEKEEENKKFLSFILNSENKDINKVVKRNGYLVLELIFLLKEKWIEEKRILIPRKFKEICGEYNSVFKTFEQQDAHDFYTFLVDKLHEETNIKSINDYKAITNPETIDTNESDLANECWANNIRKNASYFYALFMGQLKSTLICTECKTSKFKFEPFSSLELPIPEEKSITIDIILFRLPYSLRKFRISKINEENEDENNISSIKIKETIKLKLDKIKLRNYKNENINLSTEENIILDKNNESNEVINSLLNLNIPLRLKMEVDRKEKCSSIIDILKSMNDLNIEKNYNFTEFIMISKGKYINKDLIIDDTLTNYNLVFVYEMLNYKGINNIFNYEDKEKLNILSLENQEVKNADTIKEKYKKTKTLTKRNIENIPSFNFTINENDKKENYDSYEILVPIIHRIKKEKVKNFIPIHNYQYFYDFQDFIILSSSNSIIPYHLYEIIWKKYMYFLNCPSKYDKIAWWKREKKDKKNLPFIITILNKDTLSCAFCPWFRFCEGCLCDPNNLEYLNINSNWVISVEWNKKIYMEEINKNNISLIMNHNSLRTATNKTNQKKEEITIYDCLKLFTKSERMEDIQCEKCKKKTSFIKTLEIEKLPTYLVLVLKRFKYVLTNSMKIYKLVNFPLEELSLQDYLSQKNINYHYNLFGVINHMGSLNGGHYFSYVNINNTWIEFNDSRVFEINSGLETNNAYMLIYKLNQDKIKEKNLNLLGLMNRAYMIYQEQLQFEHIFNFIYDKYYNIINEYSKDCQFYFGEPVTIDGNFGFIIDITKDEEKNDDDKVNIKVKLKKGFYTGKISIKKIIKETIKKPGNINIDKLLNDRKEENRKKNVKENPIFCETQFCKIF